MMRKPSFLSLQVLLLLLAYLSVDNCRQTCIFGRPLYLDSVDSVWDGAVETATLTGDEIILEPVETGESCADNYKNWKSRPHSVSITEFGAVGDGKTLNTHAFENAMFYLRTYADKGGVQLYIPAGRWLTGSIKLISHLTLFLENEATILGSQDMKDYPIIPGLPSYGRGRELPGPRHSSLINSEGLEDVVITGDNGTIDGQGAVWWNAFRNKTLDYTRGHLVELIDSKDILISNLTFRDSPFWTIHPVYCRNVVVKDMTILAPFDSPNTDGIDPDSSQYVCIEDCYISVGDDAIAIKSGWDEYGTAYGMPSQNIDVRRITVHTRTSAGIAFGSEMSGGISNVQVDHMTIYGARWGIRFKTGLGRGGYIRNITVTKLDMRSVRTAIAFAGNYGEHPDDNWNRTDYPVIEDVSIEDVVGENITQAGLFLGLPESPFHNIHLANIVLDVKSESENWNCSSVAGTYFFVRPQPCPDFTKEELLI
jgi:polygalacturonase